MLKKKWAVITDSKGYRLIVHWAVSESAAIRWAFYNEEAFNNDLKILKAKEATS